MSRSIKIVLVDDHAIFRAGLKALIEDFEGLEVVFDSASGYELLLFLAESKPDILVVDLKMPEMSGQTVIKTVKEQYPDLKMIVLSTYDEEGIILNCLKELQVNAYLMKSTGPEDMMKALQSVFDEGYYFTPEISEIMLRGLKKRPKLINPDLPELVVSGRELEVLELVCQGHTNAEISDKLYISQRTVESHRKNILQKTNCKNTANLVAYSFKHRLISI